LYNKSRVMGDY